MTCSISGVTQGICCPQNRMEIQDAGIRRTSEQPAIVPTVTEADVICRDVDGGQGRCVMGRQCRASTRDLARIARMTCSISGVTRGVCCPRDRVAIHGQARRTRRLSRRGPTTEAMIEPTADSTTDLTTDPVTGPATEIMTDQATGPTRELTSGPARGPTTEPTTNSTTELTIEPATSPTTEPTKDLTTSPITESTTDRATSPTTELTTDLATGSMTELTTVPEIGQPTVQSRRARVLAANSAAANEVIRSRRCLVGAVCVDSRRCDMNFSGQQGFITFRCSSARVASGVCCPLTRLLRGGARRTTEKPVQDSIATNVVRNEKK